MKLLEIHIRDPFILPIEGKYYLFGTPGKYAWQGSGGFWCNISDDLENWSEPIKCFDPQKTLYVPRSLLKKGQNEFIVFESDGLKGEPIAVLTDKPDLGIIQ